MTNGGARTDPEMHVIPTEECYRLLGASEFGRIGVVAENYPLILPVNYRLDGTTVVIRTHPGTILAAAEHANVTFQVDEIDRTSRSGWSVLVRASAEEVGEEHRAELVARTLDSGVEPWAPGDKNHWIRLITHEISGRRIVAGELPALDPRAYL
jgi:nitroimidazol reductase NimA-like FMN-containing flavoprotein (pyridoxamine 5'-phosphate oxidase superfamily)